MTNKVQNPKSKFSFFKKSIAILILLILFAFLGAPIAYAENEKLRVYYSEPIGAGEKVYHLTACNWVRAYQPLVCSDETKSISENQCVYKKGKKASDNDGKVKKGTKIMGCTTEGKYVDDAKLYLDANEQEYDSQQCKDEPERQNYKYGPVWAIVDDSADEDGFYPYKWTIQGTVATKGTQKPSDNIIKEIYKSGTQEDAYPYFKTNLCATWDVVPGSAMYNDDTAKKTIKINKEEVKILEGVIKPEGEAKKLIDAGCNKDNSKEALPISLDGKDPKPLVHCSLVERITGDTGTDIFSQYVGALYKWAASIVGIVTVLIMVFSGIQISMAGGDSAKIDSAKNRIMQSIIGLVILFLAGLILYTINPGFFTG